MLNYTTGDIIRRARELADLQNSDFISWEENMHLLDESYKKLYQEVINANDKFYLTTITPSDLVVESREEKEVRYSLPSNFYQLHSIVGRVDSVPVMKKALSEGKSSMRYDIINNSLVLYGGVESHDIVINYYPIPKTLTLRAPEVQADIQGNILDCNGSKYLVTDNGKISIIDITTGITKDFESAYFENVKIGVLGKKCALVVNPVTDNVYHINVVTGVISAVGRLGNNTILLKLNGMAYYINFELIISEEESEYRFTLYDEKKVILKSSMQFEALRTEIPIFFSNGVASISDDYSTLYYLSDDEHQIFCTTEDRGFVFNEVYLNSPDLKLHLFNGSLFYADVYGVYRDDIIIHSSDDYSKYIGVNKIDYDTGYGFSVIGLDDEAVHIHSCFTDTELNFPNNFYFNFLAYQLAIAYKSKQNADVTILLQQAGEEKAHFYDSLSRDAAENCRIQNVYSNGGMF